MKAITLHQPWAWLMLQKLKQIETRSWFTRYRGPLAIHAGLKHDVDGKILHLQLNNVRGRGAIAPPWEQLTFGAVIATCQLVDCLPTNKLRDVLKAGREQWQIEMLFGNFQPGRFAWFTQDLIPVDPPIPARGYQHLWNWTPPAAAGVETGLRP